MPSAALALWLCSAFGVEGAGRSRTRTPSFTVPPHRKCVTPVIGVARRHPLHRPKLSPLSGSYVPLIRPSTPLWHAGAAADGRWYDGDDPYPDADVYDDCNIHLEVISEHLWPGGAGVTDNFAVSDDGGITRSGNAEASDAEEEPVVLGRGQRRKIVAHRYQGPIWEEH
ncbi:hypothetical protein B0H19DRAFT_1299413 [Mycena capillaripes]|nr:hypothetical protein B0H19DRAFT_1299413 [Mycena capillaripes]